MTSTEHQMRRMTSDALATSTTGRLLAAMDAAPPIPSLDRATFFLVMLADLIGYVTPEEWDHALAAAERGSKAGES